MTTEQQAQFKQGVREQWTNASEAWAARHEAFAETSKHATLALVDAADLKPGLHVLDLAGGTGEPSLTVAERVAPGGTVVCTDLVQGMNDAAKENAKKRGLTNMSFELADMEDLQFEDNRFDRVTSRFGIMFPPDTAKALGEIRRVLKPGGKAAFAVWAPPQENPNFSAVNGVLNKHNLFQAPPPGAPTPFTFAEPGSLSAKLREAGFKDVNEEPKQIEWAFRGTAAEHIAFTRSTLPNIQRALAEAPQAITDEVIAAMNQYWDGEKLNYGAKIYIATAVK
jgi:SAM-dependent methyltransferase